MNKETNIAILEGRLEGIQNAIAVSRSNATPATHASIEMAIEVLALPELSKVEIELADLRLAHAKDTCLVI
jgi:hypothetical protein